MNLSILKYVFFRVCSQQLRLVKDKEEAVVYSVMYMALGPQMAAITIDEVAATMFDYRSLAEVFGKWVFVTASYAISFGVHWLLLVKGGKSNEILRHFSQKYEYDGKSTVIALSYIFLPIIIAITVAQYVALR